MFRILYLCATIFLVPLTAQAEISITIPERSGPVRLVCMNPDALRVHAAKLTRNQILGVRHAARDGEIKWPCDDVQLSVGTQVLHERWIQTEDKWWVMAQTVQFPGGSVWVTVDPMQATYHLKPVQFLRYYPNYYVPVIFDNKPDEQDNIEGMDVDQGQNYIKRQLEALGIK